MKPNFVVFLGLNIFLFLGLFAGATAAQTMAGAQPVHSQNIKIDTLDWFDKSRNRHIPVVIYSPAEIRENLKVAVLSHGYGMKNTDYSFIAENLVADGYLVVGVQHEIAGDDPIPSTGKPSVVRRPNWERGAANILFVVGELKRSRPELDFGSLLLVGHSNGGDISMLFAEKYPQIVRRVISLDNRRMKIPRVKRPQILSIRSSDQPADEGVLPTPAEQKKFGIRIVKLPDTIHNDMWDGATETQKREINRIISEFLSPRVVSGLKS